MVFRPCLLIPIYNHGQCIRQTVARLARHGLPVFVVDDGSNPDTQRALSALAEEFDEVRVLRRPVNGGKGAAVMDGMRAAREIGYSHALQIDADGQHNADDVPRFLELSARYPEALVCGQPIYDESMPWGRRYGRHITHFWVGVELIGAGGADSMCGFRLYPLKASCALIDEVGIPTRMNFDIEILVRLAWRGVPLVNVPTRVIYPVGGVSHFDILRDNVRISWMHTRLVFGMLWRLPCLLRRKMSGGHKSTQITHAAHWAALAERGSLLGLCSVFACYRLLGRRAARLLLYPIVGYFFLTGRKAREASLDYLARVAKYRSSGRRPGWAESFRHMLAFGEAGLDKLAAWADPSRQVPVDFPERAEFERLVASKQGAVLIGSHLGQSRNEQSSGSGRCAHSGQCRCLHGSCPSLQFGARPGQREFRRQPDPGVASGAGDGHRAQGKDRTWRTGGHRRRSYAGCRTLRASHFSCRISWATGAVRPRSVHSREPARLPGLSVFLPARERPLPFASRALCRTHRFAEKKPPAAS